MPRNGESDGCAAKNTEVISVMGVLPEKICVYDEEPSKGLLNASVELVAKPWTNRREGLAIRAVEYSIDRRILGAKAGENQIFVVRRRLDARIIDTNYRVRLLDVIGDPDAWFQLRISDDPTI